MSERHRTDPDSYELGDQVDVVRPDRVGLSVEIDLTADERDELIALAHARGQSFVAVAAQLLRDALTSARTPAA
jgi:hypothetical protein